VSRDGADRKRSGRVHRDPDLLVDGGEGGFDRRRVGEVDDGEGTSQLLGESAQLGLGDRFIFAGFRRDAARTLSAFDLTVFPSLWEGTPLTAFEALAAGRPIVATDADGLLDILADGRDAAIVPKANADALAEKIVWMIDHPEDRARLAAAARDSGRQYDIAVFVRKMERLYTLLHDVSRATHRRGVLRADLSFLTSGVSG